MTTKFTLPDKKSVIFWPVGTGDSATLVLKPGEITMQIDLRHLEKADDPDEPEWPILDHLVAALPTKNGRPYLSVFALTHPDKDHIQGFGELLKRADIGELWHTPKVFRDQSDQEGMCDDAKVFRNEAERRRKAIIASPGNIKSGNRLRVIGHDDILTEEKYKNIPEACKSRPGHVIAVVDGIDLTGHFQAFVHAPFSDDQAKDRNNTSLSLNVILWEGKKYGQFFFFGDREYPTVMRVFEATEAAAQSGTDNTPFLGWHVMLCPHHCSKAVMYWQDAADKEERFKKDVMDKLAKYSRDALGYIVSSSHSAFSDGAGDNPPHKKAREQYEKIVKPGRFLCTHEYPSKKVPSPIVFVVGDEGFGFDDRRELEAALPGLAAAVTSARGGTQPPSTQIGFGESV